MSRPTDTKGIKAKGDNGQAGQNQTDRIKDPKNTGKQAATGKNEGAAKADHTKAKGGDKQKTKTDISPSAGGHADTAGTYHKGDQQKTRPDTPNKPKAEKETPKKVDDGKTDKAKASKAQTNSDTKQGDRDAAVDKAKADTPRTPVKPPPRRASYATVVNVGNTKAEGVQSKTDEATAKKPKVDRADHAKFDSTKPDKTSTNQPKVDAVDEAKIAPNTTDQNNKGKTKGVGAGDAKLDGTKSDQVNTGSKPDLSSVPPQNVRVDRNKALKPNTNQGTVKNAKPSHSSSPSPLQSNANLSFYGAAVQLRNPFHILMPTISMSSADCDMFGVRFAYTRLQNGHAAEIFETHREDLCRAVAILAKQKDKSRTLFNFSAARNKPQCKSYTLTSSSNTTIPFQRSHTSPLTIPHDMANETYRDIDALLKKLNEVLGTDYTRNRPGLSACLQGYLDESCDFGQVYGQLRPWWSRGNFERISALMQKRKEEDSMLRRNAVDGDCIVDPQVPPRRVWDLYSNRVLPFYILPVSKPHVIPPNVWAVSHSWKAENERTKYSTRINGNAWRLPLPKDTDPHNVRIELLNLGAEYVFLDVLCLRQEDKSKPGQEFRRKKEWRLDVPTIGYVYKPPRTTVVYFNGLGETLDMMPKGGFDSDFHWFQRVWTLQEAADNWLPGGLTEASIYAFPKPQTSRASMEFLGRLLNITQSDSDLFSVLHTICNRKCSKPVDAVSGLAYLLQCTTLPIYDASVDVEGAWEALIQSMSPSQRLALLICWGGSGDSHSLFTWRPSWRQVQEYGPALRDLQKDLAKTMEVLGAQRMEDIRELEDEMLEYLPNAGLQDGSDAYFHYGYVIYSCTIQSNEQEPVVKSPMDCEASSAAGSDNGSDTDDDETVVTDTTEARMPDFPSHGTVTIKSSKTGSHIFKVARFGCPLNCNKEKYTLVGVAKCKYWIVGRNPGSRRVGASRSGATVLSKVTVLELDTSNGRTPQGENLGQVDMVVYR